MPDLRPFAGTRYAADTKLEDVVCPPYDIISADEHRRLYERHPNNAVRVELPFSETPDEAEEERYKRAGQLFRRWLRDGVLVQDGEPALFVLRQDFRSRDGDRKHVVGVIGALELEPLGADSGVLPHERTMPGPVEDRLALLRACPVNISPIYGIYSGRGSLSPYYDSLAHRPAVARVVDEHGTLHRLWVIRAPAEIEMLRAALRKQPLVIADGHHRYETALAYHREKDGASGHHDAVMCLCVDADCEDIQVLPYNRVFRSHVPVEDIEQRLSRFGARRLAERDGLEALAESPSDHPLLFVLPDGDVLIDVPDEAVTARVGERAAAWRSLDVVALHEAVIPHVFPEGIDRLLFSSDPDGVVSLVRQGGWDGGVILRPLRPAQVIDVARSGERVPQKASYFSPKAITGLVFRSLL
ncbi:DUF1015 domain-containing protein [soil metagenome]